MLAAIVAVLITALPGTASAAPKNRLDPLVNCYYENTDGSILVVLGYTSTYATTQTIPIGTRNYFTPSTYSSSLPTVFKPGTNDGVATLRIAAADVSSSSWYLDGTTVSYGSASSGVPLCTQAQLPAFANGAALAIVLLAAGIAGALVVRRMRRAAPTSRPNGSAPTLGGDHA